LRKTAHFGFWLLPYNGYDEQRLCFQLERLYLETPYVYRKVNRVFHDTWLGDPPELGASFHFRQGYTPAYVLTDLERNIILGNSTPASDLDIPKRWLLTGFRSHVTRLWAASTAVVMATVHLPDLGEQPPPPPPELRLESEVQIWAGYTDHPRVVQADDFCERLLPVFTGVVENLAVTVTGNGGYTLTVQLRDRMKWFLDSLVTYQPGVDTSKPSTRRFSIGTQSRSMPSRSQILLELARRAIGHIEGDNAYCEVCGKRIELGEVYDTAVTGPQPANVFEGRLSPRVVCPRAYANPFFHIYTQRSYRGDGVAGRGFSIDNRIAVEMMRYLAMSEVYPTELFQDHRDGNFYYTPRFNLVDGFASPDYFFRLYYVKNYPSGVTPDINQMALSFKEEASSIGMKTNFIVSRVGTMAYNTLDADWLVHLRAVPNSERVAESYACKFMEVRDDQLHNVAEAALVALHLARIHAKDVRAALLVVLGDPSFVPGEVVQVVGSPLWGEQTLQSERILREREEFDRRNRQYNEYLRRAAEDAAVSLDNEQQIKTGSEYVLRPQSGLVAENVPVEARAGDQLNPDVLVCGANRAPLPQEPKTLWRVEAVLQKANMGGSKGYVTELLLDQLF